MDSINWIKINSPKVNINAISTESSQGVYFGTGKGDIGFFDYNDSKCLLLYKENSKNLQDYSINTIAVNPFNGSDILAGRGNSNGILKSSDFGRNWNQALTIKKTFIPVHIFSICFYQSNKIFAGTNIGLFISEDNGDSWVIYEYSIEIDYYSIVRDDEDNIWFGTSNGLYLKRKNDHRLKHIALKYIPVRSVVSLPDDSILLVTGFSIFTALNKFNDAVFILKKNAKKPKNILSSNKGESVNGVCANSRYNIIIAKLHSEGNSLYSLILHSDNCGTSWSNISNGIYYEKKIECFAINPIGYVFSGTGSGLYRSAYPIMEKKTNTRKTNKNYYFRKIAGALILSFFIFFIGLIILPQISPSFSRGLANKLRPILGTAFVSDLESISFRTYDLFDKIYYRVFKELPSQPIQNNFLLSAAGNYDSLYNYNKINSKSDSFSNNLVWSHFGPLISGKMILESAVSSPDSDRPYVKVILVKFDLSQLDVNIMPGLEHKEFIPDSNFKNNIGMVPKEQIPQLLAAFNGGFKKTHGDYGFMVNGLNIISPKKNAATIGLYRNGSVKIGAWERDIFPDENLVTFRQNCPLLIDKYQINHSVFIGKKSDWGYTIDNNDPTWRSGIGISKNSRYLIYAGGKSLTVENLAIALKEGDSYFAMQLDINPQWVCLVTYIPNCEKTSKFPVTAITVFDQMTFSKNLFLEPFERDFFYITKKYD